MLSNLLKCVIKIEDTSNRSARACDSRPLLFDSDLWWERFFGYMVPITTLVKPVIRRVIKRRGTRAYWQDIWIIIWYYAQWTFPEASCGVSRRIFHIDPIDRISAKFCCHHCCKQQGIPSQRNCIIISILKVNTCVSFPIFSPDFSTTTFCMEKALFPDSVFTWWAYRVGWSKRIKYRERLYRIGL